MPLSKALFRARRLEKRGHAERIPHPDDRRSFLLRLTDDGDALLRRAELEAAIDAEL
jgi:DNA-binding MarR family transcriptional regulator